MEILLEELYEKGMGRIKGKKENLLRGLDRKETMENPSRRTLYKRSGEESF